jgi:intracellular sulfur oxidation DsrE/DsrF family protein
MTQDSLPSSPRRSFLSRFHTGLASLTALAGVAMAQEKTASPSRWEPARHDEDNWLDKNQAKHRVVFDSIASDGLGEALAFAANYYSANKTDYKLENSDLAVVIVLRHRAAPFGYNDAIWAKYGEHLATRIKFEDPKTKSAPKLNVFNATGYGEQLSNRGVTLDGLGKSGAQFAVCKLSTRANAGAIAKATGGKADEVFAEISANLIPNARLVAAGIVAVNRAQERGYTLMSI